MPHFNHPGLRAAIDGSGRFSLDDISADIRALEAWFEAADEREEYWLNTHMGERIGWNGQRLVHWNEVDQVIKPLIETKWTVRARWWPRLAELVIQVTPHRNMETML